MLPNLISRSSVGELALLQIVSSGKSPACKNADDINARTSSASRVSMPFPVRITKSSGIQKIASSKLSVVAALGDVMDVVVVVVVLVVVVVVEAEAAAADDDDEGSILWQ